MRLMLPVLTVLLCLALSGCETCHGLGRDFEAIGLWMQSGPQPGGGGQASP